MTSSNGVNCMRRQAPIVMCLAFFIVLESSVCSEARSRKDAQVPVQKSTNIEINKIPAGPLHIVVSLNDQSVTLYANGEVVARSGVSTGMKGHPTPTGVFSVIQKDKWHRSNLYSDAPMPFMQRITWSGIALHAGTLPGYPASHGCIRLTHSFATQLWRATGIGTRVIVAREVVTPVEIAEPVVLRSITEPTGEETTLNPPRISTVEVLKPDEGSSRSIEEITAPKVSDGDVPRDKTKSPSSDTQAQMNNGAALAEPVSIFASAKERKLFVRQGFKPIFDVPLTIRNPQAPLGGTHVFTAMGLQTDGVTMRWTVLSLSNDTGERRDKSKRNVQIRQVTLTPAASGQKAMAALDRIEVPNEAVVRISKMLTTGSSLIISDEGISNETGKGTDFVVLTPRHAEQLADKAGPEKLARNTNKQSAVKSVRNYRDSQRHRVKLAIPRTQNRVIFNAPTWSIGPSFF
jgi:L,D-transpeptidase-like protein